MSTVEDWIKHVPKPEPLRGNEQWNVFLSYGVANKAWVINLYDALRRYGHKVLLDRATLVDGDPLQDSQDEVLAVSKAGVLICSSKANDSEWFRNIYESMAGTAVRRPDFKFLIVRIDSGKLPLFISAGTCLDFSSHPDGPNGGELLHLLHTLVGRQLSEEAVGIALDFDQHSIRASNQISAAIQNSSSGCLKNLFAERGASWRVTASLSCMAAQGLTQIRAYDDAVAMLLEIEQEFPEAIRPKQLHALALLRRSRGGGLQEDLINAQRIMAGLYDSGERDPETLGIYASTWMERYERSGEIDDLKNSRDLYAEAFAVDHNDYYTGINAAAKSVLLDEPERAIQLAFEVQRIVGTEPHPGDYWMTATVAEVWLIQKNYREAARNYEAAVAIASSQTGSHESTWKQACHLMGKLGPEAIERDMIRKVFENLPDCDQF